MHNEVQPTGAVTLPAASLPLLLGKERPLSAGEGLGKSDLLANKHLNHRAVGLDTCTSPEGSFWRGTKAVWYVTVGYVPVQTS